MKILHIHSDGGARGNPGPAAIGCVGEYLTVQDRWLQALRIHETSVQTEITANWFSRLLYDGWKALLPQLHRLSNLNHAQSLAFTHSEYIGITTNNIAEYQAVLSGLGRISADRTLVEGVQGIIWCVDSLLVCEQLRGAYKIKNAELATRIGRIHHIQAQLPISVLTFHVPRTLNSSADQLVNRVLDQRVI